MNRGQESSHSLTLQDQTTEFLRCTAPNGEAQVEVLLSNEALWLIQERMAELFVVQRPVITKHLINILENNGVQELSVCFILEHTTAHGAIAGKTQPHQIKLLKLKDAGNE